MEGDQLTIGRDSINEIVINDAEISRRHARLTFQGGKYVLEDLGSTNGTFVNGQRLAGPRVLKAGEVVSFGEQIVMVFEATNFDAGATVVSPRAAVVPSVSRPAPLPLRRLSNMWEVCQPAPRRSLGHHHPKTNSFIHYYWRWCFPLRVYVYCFLLVGGCEFPVVHVLPLPRRLLITINSYPARRVHARGVFYFNTIYLSSLNFYWQIISKVS